MSLFRSSLQGLQKRHAALGTSGGTPLLLDDTGQSVSVALSFHKLKSDYSGACFEVCRANDGAIQQFGFANNFYDKAAILSWLGGSAGLVKQFFGQDGGINLIQTDSPKMPTLDLVNDQIVFDGADDCLISSATVNLSGTNKVSVFSRLKTNDANAVQIFLEHGDDINNDAVAGFGCFSQTGWFGAAFKMNHYSFKIKDPNNTEFNTHSVTFDRTAEAIYWVNGSLFNVNQAAILDRIGSPNFGNNYLYIGARTGSSYYTNGAMKSLIVLPVLATTEQRGLIEAHLSS